MTARDQIYQSLLTFLFPTSMMGTLGQKCFTSGVHFSGMFSRESGESVEDMKIEESSTGSLTDENQSTNLGAISRLVDWSSTGV